MPITAAAKEIGIRYDMAFSSLKLIQGEANGRKVSQQVSPTALRPLGVTFGTLTLGMDMLGTLTGPALAWPAPMNMAQRAAETLKSFVALILCLSRGLQFAVSGEMAPAMLCPCRQGPKEAVALTNVLYHPDLYSA